MTLTDWLCTAWFTLGLIVLAVAMFRQAYRRANPKPRAPLTSWQAGRRG